MLRNEWTEDASVNGGSMKDVWMRWVFQDEGDTTLGLRVGQQRTLFGKAATTDDPYLETISRDLASLLFADQRQTGAMVEGQHLPDDKLSWSFGAYNGGVAPGAFAAISEETSLATKTGNELSYVANIRFDPMGDMSHGDLEGYTMGDLDHSEELMASIGAGVEIGNGTDSAGADLESTNININGALKASGIHVLGDVFIREDEPQTAGLASEDSTGWNVQGSYTLDPGANSETQWSFVAGITGVDLDGDATMMNVNGIVGSPLGAASGDIMHITLGVNAYYKKHKMKTMVNYIMQSVDPDVGVDSDDHIIAIMFSLVF